MFEHNFAYDHEENEVKEQNNLKRYQFNETLKTHRIQEFVYKEGFFTIISLNFMYSILYTYTFIFALIIRRIWLVSSFICNLAKWIYSFYVDYIYTSLSKVNRFLQKLST